MRSIVYGPVPSWRLGSSLGIDLISTQGKTCSFDCIYCQLGRTVHALTQRRELVELSGLVTQLQQMRNVAADYATFSGVGEPTLASNLGQAIEIVRATLRLPVAVLTNSSLMPRPDVRQELARADVVVAKLDAPSEELFEAVNRPFVSYSLADILQGLKRFRQEYQGKLVLQMMFVEANKGCAAEMARIADGLSPDEAQINTPLRRCAVRPLPPEDIAEIRRAFIGFGKVVSVYEASRPEVVPLSPEETRRRRPQEQAWCTEADHGDSHNHTE